MDTMKPKKKVAFFGIKFYPSKGGVSRVAESIVRYVKEDFDITLYCYKDPEAEDYLEGVKTIQFPSIPGKEVGVFIYFFICTLHILLFKRFDLIHVHKTDAAFFIPLLRLKGKVIATSHEAPYTRDKWNGIGKFYFRFMERVFILPGATLTSVSNPLSEFYYEKYKRLVHYVPNGVQLFPDRDPFAAEDLLRQHGVSGDYLFFAAKRIMSTKGLHTFLQAMKNIGYQGDIVIAGQDTHASGYGEKIEKLSEGLQVKKIGFVSDRAILMSLVEKAKIFVFPSEHEGLSIMLLEVGSTGETPLICSDIPENTQVFRDDHVLYFQDKNADDLAEKFLWAEDHMDEMGQKAKRARTHVLKEFSEERMARRYNVLYRELLGMEPLPTEVVEKEEFKLEY